MPKDNFDRRPIPIDKDPPFICMQIMLPDDPEYLQAFQDQMEKLALWSQYDRTGNTDGKIVADVWRRAMATLRTCVNDCDSEDCDCDDGDYTNCQECEDC